MKAIGGSNGWYTDGRALYQEIKGNAEDGPLRIARLHWYPEVIDAVAYKTQEGSVTARAFKIKVRGQSEIISMFELIKGQAWPRFLDAYGYQDRKISDVLVNVVLEQAAELPHIAGRPLFEAGRLQMPPAEYLPQGYTRGEGTSLDALCALVREIAPHPTAALILSLSAIAPWVADLKLQPFTLHIESGDSTCGKTTGITAAAALWGVGFKGVVRTYSGTPLGLQGALRDLGCLPAFRDELHTLGLPGYARSALFSAIMEGCQRAARTRDDIARPSASWSSILFSTGNETAVPPDHASAGHAKGVLELHADDQNPVLPQSVSDRVRALTNAEDMHGAWVPYALGLDTEHVRTAFDNAGIILGGKPLGGLEWQFWRHMSLALAGAALLAEVTQCTEIVEAVRRRALEFLESTADRLAELDADNPRKLFDAVAEFRLTRPTAFNLGDGSRVTDQLGVITRIGGRPATVIYTTKIQEIAKAAGIEDMQSALRILRSKGLLITSLGKGLKWRGRANGELVTGYAFASEPEIGGDSGDSGDTAPLTSGDPVPPSATQEGTPGGTQGGTVQQPALGDDVDAEEVPATNDKNPAPDQRAELDQEDDDPAAGNQFVSVRDDRRPCIACGEGTIRQAVAGPLHSTCAAPAVAELGHDRGFAEFRTEVVDKFPTAQPAEVEAAFSRWLTMTDGLHYTSGPAATGIRLFQSLGKRYGSVPAALKVEPTWCDPTGRTIDGGRIVGGLSLNWSERTAVTPGGFLRAFDVNGQFLAAAKVTALGSDGPPERRPYSGSDALKLPGYGRVAEDGPGPVPGSTLRAGEWVPMPLLLRMGQDRKLPELAEVLVWDKRPDGTPNRRLWLSLWAERVAGWRTELMAAAAAGDRIAAMVLPPLKHVYASFLGGMMRSERYNHTETFRPDWNDQNVAMSRANACRALDKATIQPYGMMLDTAFFLTPTADGPVGLTVSKQLGKWKETAVIPVTAEIAELLPTLRPAGLAQFVRKHKGTGL